jgi:hypothetical protein
METPNESALVAALADIATGEPQEQSLELLQQWRQQVPADSPQAHVENCNAPKTIG